MEEEIKHLNYVVEEFKKIIYENDLKQNMVRKNYSNDVDTMIELLSKFEKKKVALKKNITKPYFARIDFKADDNDYNDVCYIGKIGTINEDNKIVTVDWRAPIASLYYDNMVGKCSYLAPEGIISGNLLLKRQYEIEDSKLINYHDVDVVSNDELLNNCLNSSVDSRLKNIVSTIQKEQNEIIRKPIEQDIIVQGVAGSGKTTVALHRIAFLVYQYRKNIDINQYMIIGPNKFFVNYISSVLPDLDVNGVPEYDLHEFVNAFLEEKINLEKSKDTFLTKYKFSMEYKKILDEYIYKLNLLVVPDDDLKMFGFSIVNNNIIKKIYKKVENETYYLSDRVERTIMFLKEYIKDNEDSILVKANDYMAKLYDDEFDSKKLKDISKKRNDLSKEIKGQCSHILEKYFNVVNTKTSLLYKMMLKELNIGGDNKIRYDDLAGLLYLKYRIAGNYNYRKYMHVVVDEAQDYGSFFFYVLKRIMKNATFSIFGDLAQTIYEYRTIDSWDNVILSGIQNNMCYLTKSYRTTIEIMNQANLINKHLGLTEAEAVIRHGPSVRTIENANLLQLILELKEKKYKTIAIISKDYTDSKKVFESLKDKIDIRLIDEESQDYTGGIVSITSTLSKGLEFDGVVINNVDNDHFDINNEFDLKLLYVSMTRALHELVLMCDKDYFLLNKTKK